MGQGPQITVPDGENGAIWARGYRTGGEKIPYAWGRNTVLCGKLYRTRGEGIPFFTGSFTVPVRKEYRTGEEVCRRFFLQKGEKQESVGIAPVCVSALMFLFLFGKKGRKGFGQRRAGVEAVRA